MFYGLITIIGGILAASSLIIARKPNAKDLIDKLAPYQGYVGLALFGWGVWTMIHLPFYLRLLSVVPMHAAFSIANGVADVVVGFLLGFGLITKYALSSSPAAISKGQQIRAKLAPMQGTFGLVAIAAGVLYVVL